LYWIEQIKYLQIFAKKIWRPTSTWRKRLCFWIIEDIHRSLVEHCCLSQMFDRISVW
jgi:hypothetical protein